MSGTLKKPVSLHRRKSEQSCIIAQVLSEVMNTEGDGCSEQVVLTLGIVGSISTGVLQPSVNTESYFPPELGMDSAHASTKPSTTTYHKGKCTALAQEPSWAKSQQVCHCIHSFAAPSHIISEVEWTLSSIKLLSAGPLFSPGIIFFFFFYSPWADPEHLSEISVAPNPWLPPRFFCRVIPCLWAMNPTWDDYRTVCALLHKPGMWRTHWVPQPSTHSCSFFRN